MSQAYIGADPGMGGALALYCLEPSVRMVIEVVDMPALVIDGKRRMDFWKLAALLETWKATYSIARVAVERVHAMPLRGAGGQIRQSPNGLFEFGFAAGALQQAVVSAGLSMVLIPPATWKAVYGLRGGRENKDMSRQKASQMFPTYAHKWERKKDDGRAEAVLLAHYASKLQEGPK
jgi:crossover junction endodeoxyribonuclease RuvC